MTAAVDDLCDPDTDKAALLKFTRLAASIAAASLLAPAGGSAGTLGAVPAGAVSRTSARAAAIARRHAMISALQAKVKYVFVLYQENRSFDSYFGTFPNAEGIYSNPPSATPGFSQRIENENGSFSTISPFRIGPAQYAADTDDVDHSHPRMLKKMDVTSAGPQMDAYALVEEQKHIPKTQTLPTLQAKQYGELAMAHEDCDTIPLLWNFANRFVLFDHVFQSYTGPSTPGNLAIIGAQAGETQYGLHPNEAYTDNGASAAGVPVLNDRNPAWGPYNPGDSDTPASNALNLTYATLPLTLSGHANTFIPGTDPRALLDFADVRDDLAAVAQSPYEGWGWYQEGYDREPGQATAATSLANYVTHHNGPQYFGYIANSIQRRNLHGLGDFMHDVATGSLMHAGVFYVKGGFQNIMGLKPADPDPKVQAAMPGDDDHPGYSDAQISEALVAQSINTIAASKYWSQSAIVIAWDDSEGDYDHVPPPLRFIGPGAGNTPADFLSDGPRIPLLVISPFSRSHYVSHAYGDQGSVVKFVDTVFGLTPLADLPDEQRALRAGELAGKFNLGPDDGETSGVDDLLDAFEPDRVLGTLAPLPASFAYTPTQLINHLPQQTGQGCRSIGVVPVDELRGIRNVIPADFNPRPGTVPSLPAVQPLDTRRDVRRAHDLDD